MIKKKNSGNVGDFLLRLSPTRMELASLSPLPQRINGAESIVEQLTKVAYETQIVYRRGVYSSVE